MHGTGLAGRRVLVVEDEYFIAMDLARALEGEGASVEIAGDCDDALALLHGGRFDAAVLDIVLKDDERCYPVAEELRRRGAPFLFVSGYDEADGKFRDVTLLQKPFDMKDVVRTLSQMTAVADG